MSEKIKVKETIIDGVQVIEYSDGSQHFEILEDKSKKKEQEENKGFFQRVKNWWDGLFIKPYVKVRDLADPTGERANDPFDADVGSDGKNAVEVGIKVTF